MRVYVRDVMCMVRVGRMSDEYERKKKRERAAGTEQKG